MVSSHCIAATLMPFALLLGAGVSAADSTKYRSTAREAPAPEWVYDMVPTEPPVMPGWPVAAPGDELAIAGEGED